jgi:hypothetical protein
MTEDRREQIDTMAAFHKRTLFVVTVQPPSSNPLSLRERVRVRGSKRQGD